MRKFKFDYDGENDDLFLFRADSKSKGSVEFGKKIVLDFNKDRELVGIEILDATKTLSELAPAKKEFINLLKNLRECKIEIRENAGLIIVRMFLISKAEEVPTTITVPCLA